MAYVITKTDGTTLVTVAENTVDTTTDLSLIGKNYFNYGYAQNHNFVKLLENFANTSAPSNPLVGQIWYDKTLTSAKLKVYDGTRFKVIGSAIESTAEPSYWKDGDFWLDTTSGRLYVKTTDSSSNSAARLLGPLADPALGTNGFVHSEIATASTPLVNDKQIVSMYVGGTRMAAFSEEAFTPNSLTNFPQLMTGLNLPTTTKVYIASNDGVSLGASAQGQLKAASGSVTLANTASSGKLYLEVIGTAATPVKVVTLMESSSSSTAGFVGINTTTPTTTLDVFGGIKTNTGFTSSSNTGVIFGSTGNASLTVSSTNILITNSTSNATLSLRTNNGGTPTNMLTINPIGSGGTAPWTEISGVIRLTSAGNILVGGTATPTNATNALVLYNGTNPSANPSNGSMFFADAGTMYVLNATGTRTAVSPHMFELIPGGASEPMAWSHYSYFADGSKINVDMLKLVRLVERLTGEKLVYTA